MKLYTTLPSILTLVTWVSQSRLVFGHSAHRLAVRPPALGQTKSYSVQPCLLLAIPSFSIESVPLLDSKALSRQL
jgi:hypothetical protein